MNKAFSVWQINKYIVDMFKQDFVLNSVVVTGEVSNCKSSSTGHIFFTLKDERSAISVVMFAGDRWGLKCQLKDGLKIEVKGRIEVYEKDGKYQLYAKTIKEVGAGELFEQFNKLKAELEERGMFSIEYKQPIPKYIKTLGIVTASTGAAVRDIIQISQRRNPYVQLILYPAMVQGENAAPSIVKGIKALEKQGVDVIIVGRGGGSIEDLWAFNEEIVAQAIFDCSIPIISAVGHETDFTIADYVADLRAPTPSAAAELAVYEFARLMQELSDKKEDMMGLMLEHINRHKTKAMAYKQKLSYLSPENQLRQKRTNAMALEDKLNLLIRRVLDKKRNEFNVRISALKGLSPLDKLNQGYSVALSETNKRINSIENVNVGEKISLYVSDGKISALVEDKNGNS